MLVDAASIQASDARYVNRAIERGQLDSEPVEPLYDEQDVKRALAQMISLPYHRRQTIAKGVTLTFLDAGHVLGSAQVVLDVHDRGEEKRIVFTGDLGRHHLPILRDPEVPTNTHVLLLESTYGDRRHPSIEEMDEELAAVITRTHARGGKVIIPSFALERAQEIIFSLKKLRGERRIPPVPVYVDSPLTVGITEVFRLHPECYDDESRALLRGGHSPFDFEGLRYISEVEESKHLSASTEAAVVIAASGMCEGGRVLHHLLTTMDDPRNTILIVGFQAQHTLGRRIVERRRRVKVFGLARDLNAEVVVLNGFSAHADQRGLLAFAEAVRDQGTLEHIALVHGDPPAQRVLQKLLRERGIEQVMLPNPGDTLRVGKHAKEHG
jgi:metallo-beta-lactamase family protein